jgi:ribonuclease J
VDKTPVGYIYVDGSSVGDVNKMVVRDRQMLSKDGILMVVASIERASGQLVAGPDVVSRGFAYMRQNNDLLEATREVIRDALNKRNGSRTQTDSAFVNRKIKEVVSDFLYQKTRRRPMVLPLVMEV